MKKTLKWSELAPEGVSAKKEALFTGIALAASSVWSLTVLRRMGAEWKLVTPGAAEGRVVSLMGWHGMLGTALFGFYLVAAAMVVLAMWHYGKITKVKNQKRGKDAGSAKPAPVGSLHRRAMAIPLLGLILAVGLSLILYFLYRAAFLEYRGRIEEIFNAAHRAAHS